MLHLRGRPISGALELDLHGLARGLLDGEVLALLEPERARDDVRWELLAQVVVLQHGVVVELPGVRDLALGACLAERQALLIELLEDDRLCLAGLERIPGDAEERRLDSSG